MNPMRLATREEVYNIDKAAAEDFGLSSSVLIEKAGKALADQFEKIFHQQQWPKEPRIGVWCGQGHNGADGRVMAHLLRERNFKIELLQGTDWKPENFDIVVDALFGIGLNRPLSADLQKQISSLNQSHKKVFAVDIPSGLDANRGVVLGAAVRAQWTLTIAPAKPGLFLQEGPAHAGRICSLDIGLPKELIKQKAQSMFFVGAQTAKALLPARKAVSNKSSFGRLLVLAGSEGMEGAAALVCEAAARMGCGYVTLCSSSQSVYKRVRPDFLQISLDSFFDSDLQKYDAVVVGPGLGVNKHTKRILDHLLKQHTKVLVDADALTVLAQGAAQKLPEDWLLTPHAGELGRLLNKTAKELEEDRPTAIQKAQEQWGSLFLLKGFRTMLRDAKKSYIIGSGNVALAKAGSGDVLAGFIGSLMAQGLSPIKAGCLGAYLHGRIADDWLRRGHSTRTLMASDLPELIDASLRSLKKTQ